MIRKIFKQFVEWPWMAFDGNLRRINFFDAGENKRFYFCVNALSKWQNGLFAYLSPLN